jgi:hypothetical protein
MNSIGNAYHEVDCRIGKHVEKYIFTHKKIIYFYEYTKEATCLHKNVSKKSFAHKWSIGKKVLVIMAEVVTFR